MFVWGNYFTIAPTVCVDYQQNRVDSKDTLIKRSVCVRTALLKRVFFRSKESSSLFKSYIGGYSSCVCKTFRSVCSLFSALNYLSSSTYIHTYINHNNRYECTNLESLLRYNLYKHNNYINKCTLYILNEDMNGWRRDRYKTWNWHINWSYRVHRRKKRSTNILYTLMDTGPCQTLRLLSCECLFTWPCSILKNCWSADWLNMKKKSYKCLRV